MGQTFAEKALARAAGVEAAVAGQILDVRPDVVLSHDNTAPIARIFRAMGASRVRHPERLAITLDHAVPAPSTLHATNHAEVRQFVAEQGIPNFFEAGRGICHQVLGEEALVLPGQVILGADSHTTHFGWLGAFGAGVGRSEVAALWATGELWLRVPETIRIELEGQLAPGVTAKDLALAIMAFLGTDSAAYKAVEFAGPGLASLSIESRMVLPNMMAEAGVKNAYMEPDEAIFHWLAERKLEASRGNPGDLRDIQRPLAAAAIYPDEGASYQAVVTVDLARVEPLVACPHSPANVVPLSQVTGTRVDQAFLGTCTNGRLEDLAAAAAVLRDENGRVRRVAPGTRLLVIPASNQVMLEALAAGYIETFLAAGAMIGTPGCGPCMGNHMGVPAPGEVTISSANRNFRGRMGTAESDIYLASPAVVAASALAGYITGPGDVAGRSSVAGSSQAWAWRFEASTSLAGAGQPGQQPPDIRPLASGDVVRGRVWKYGDDVNTDVIFPGKYTYTLREPAEWARHALEDLDPDFAGQVRPGDIIVAGRNWGCGSSREQAVGALKAAGVAAIIATSFARIYYRNAVNNGLLPVICPAAVDGIQPGETVSIDLGRCVVLCQAGEFSFPPLSPSLRAIVAAGGLVAMVKDALCPSSA